MKKESKSEILFLYQGIFRNFNPNRWFECDRGRYDNLRPAELSTIIAWLPYPGQLNFSITHFHKKLSTITR